MILLSVRKLFAVFVIICLSSLSYAQSAPAIEATIIKEDKPYKILTSGKQVTVKSSKEIKSVMVWTSSGHRIIEEKAVNSTSYSFNLKIPEKVYFIMIQFEGS